MKELITALVRQALPGLIEAEARDGGVRDWLDFGAFQIGATSESDAFKIESVDLLQFTPFQKFDFSRFALSSYETMAFCVRDPKRPRAIGWPLVKAYYAAFFGAHALMRMTGQAVVRIEPKLARRLTELAKLFGLADVSMTSGNYHLRLLQLPSKNYMVELSRLPDSGGAHDAFWRAFKRFLEQVASDSVTNSVPDSGLIVSQIGELIGSLTTQGANDGSRLSIVRNEINYQHLYGVWFPYQNAQSELRHVASIGYQKSSSIRLDIDPKKEPIKAFWSAAISLAALSFDAAEALISQSGSKSAMFVRNWRRLAT